MSLLRPLHPSPGFLPPVAKIATSLQSDFIVFILLVVYIFIFLHYHLSNIETSFYLEIYIDKSIFEFIENIIEALFLPLFPPSRLHSGDRPYQHIFLRASEAVDGYPFRLFSLFQAR